MKCNELFSSLLMKTKVTNGPYSYLMRKTAPFEELFDAPGRGYNLQHLHYILALNGGRPCLYAIEMMVKFARSQTHSIYIY